MSGLLFGGGGGNNADDAEDEKVIDFSIDEISISELQEISKTIKAMDMRLSNLEDSWSPVFASIVKDLEIIQDDIREIELIDEEAEKLKKEQAEKLAKEDQVQEMELTQKKGKDLSNATKSLVKMVSDEKDYSAEDLIFLIDAKKNSQHAKYCPVDLNSDMEDLNCVQKVRQHIYFTMHDESYSRTAYLIFVIVMILIIISTCAYILETNPHLKNKPIFDYLEWTVSLAFTLEYVLRITCVAHPIKYFFEIMNFVDFLAVAPFYVAMVFNDKDWGFLRMIRVVRLTRLSRLRKSAVVSDNTEVLQNTLIKTMQQEFGMIFALISLQVLIMSSLVYTFEKSHITPDGSPSSFQNIPVAMWWCCVTICTVGYGDMYPQTVYGKLLGVVTASTGLVVVAIFIIIITSNFNAIYRDYTSVKRYKKKRKRKNEKKKKEEAAM